MTDHYLESSARYFVDRRDFIRSDVPGRVFIRRRDDFSTIVYAIIVDVSANGIRVVSDVSVPAKSLVDVVIITDDDELVYSMSAVVSWSSRSFEDYYFIGLELLFERENRDYHDWRALYLL